MTARPLLILLGGCALAGPVVAGDLNAPAAPTDPGSAMYTLEDLYNRLDSGTAGTPRSGEFAEPATGPGSTMSTLTDIMDKMPALDDTNGATPEDVLTGKTFWGLTIGAWGPQTGTVPAGDNVTGADGQLVITLPDGLYSESKTATASDSDLAPANIKSGVNIFDVVGTYTGTTGPTFSAPFPVPKTGQTASYATGDDGDLEKGVVWPNPRFTANGNGTVTDNLTGLVWLQDANCAGAMNWNTALAWVVTLKGDNTMCTNTKLNDGSVAGQWRLPTIKELSSLVDAGANSPVLPAGHPFTGVQFQSDYDYYWSSTTFALDANLVVVVYLGTGSLVGVLKATNNYYVWPVRGGQ